MLLLTDEHKMTVGSDVLTFQEVNSKLTKWKFLSSSELQVKWPPSFSLLFLSLLSSLAVPGPVYQSFHFQPTRENKQVFLWTLPEQKRYRSVVL